MVGVERQPPSRLKQGIMKAIYYLLAAGGFLPLLHACGGDSQDPDWEPPAVRDSGPSFGALGRDAARPVQREDGGQPARDAGTPPAPVDAGSTRPDAGKPDSGAAGAQCIAPGKQCEPNTCCAGAQCVMDPAVAIAVCAANCTSSAECQSGCCARVNGNPLSACAPVLYCNSTQPPPRQCLAAGDACSPTGTLCCPGTRCIVDPLTALQVCAYECTQNFQCTSQCCSPLRDEPSGSVCGPIDHCTGGGTGGGPRISLPAGCGALILVASDGTFLGEGTSNTVAVDSVCNPVGLHGGPVGTASIFASVGLYGGSIGTMSAYSTLASSPPALFCSASEALVAFVTKNTLKAPRIDPDELCAVLAASGL